MLELPASFILLSGGVGSIAGALLFGTLADKHGRKPMLISATALCAVSAGALTLVPEGNWVIFSLLRIFVGAGLGGVGSIQLVILSELTPSTLRVKLLGWPLIFPSVGTMIAAFTTASLIAALGLLPLFLCLPFALLMPESPRWLIVHGRPEQARRSIALLAGVPVDAVPAHSEAIPQQTSASLRELYRRPGRFWLTVIAWLTISTVGYGVYLWGPTITSLLLNVSVGTAAKYFVGISVAGLLGRALFSVLPAMIGRVWSGRLLGFAIAVTLGAAALLHDAFVGPLPWFVVMLALGAIFYDGGYCTLAPYATEVFPTRLAARGSGLAQSANGLGKIIGPLCLALIAGSNDLVSAKATEAAIQPAFLFLAACGAMLGLAFARLLFAHSLIAAAMAAKQLADSDRRFVRNCPLPHVESVKGMRCNVCHGTPKQIGQSPWHAAKPRPPSAT